MTSDPRAQPFLRRVRNVARVTAVAGSLGLTRVAYHWGDRIGLPPQGAAEKRHAFVSGRHARTAAAEVLAWEQGSAQAGAVSLDPQWPVAVVTAGDAARMGEWNIARRAPEQASRAGYYENVPEAAHATLLGQTHNGAVLRAVDHILAALAPSK